ncbi:RNA polymerase sigma-70 factor, ECF subfamily [Polaribacter sp. KT25b]|uniref:RNA polymerase sigma factor n=1 Tax=Polaribacter sp. KT25b TaxID=1855336 RepID=UPI00087BBB90|nr:RNA polymerase sigma-70 factor [Polaribacter sp. KT25b]SDR79831.1 RNA polymerase sigma-70 factor, ECF subfamily [Polaribacter sp. KT25b]
MKSFLEDFTLAKNIKKDDEKAFRTLFDRYYKKLLNYANTFTGDLQEAEDIVQQVFITLWTNRKKIDTKKSIKSFLYKITYNSYIDIYRKQKHKESFFDEIKERALRDRISDNDEIIEQRILKLKVAIDSLPKRSKEILQMNKFEGLKYKEIANQLNISVKTVEAHMHTAFKKIRETFKSDDLFLFMLSKIFR